MSSNLLRKSGTVRANGDGAALEPATWRVKWRLEKFFNARDHRDTVGRKPDETIIHDGNLLMYGGVSCLWQCLIGNGTVTAGQSLTFFNNAQAAIGVGDSTTAAAATQTDLQASSNKLRTGMVATYPLHTDGVISGAATITFQSSYSTGQANYAWNEVAVFNSATAATGRMLNRLAPGGGFGTKSGGTWTMTVSITIS